MIGSRDGAGDVETETEGVLAVEVETTEIGTRGEVVDDAEVSHGANVDATETTGPISCRETTRRDAGDTADCVLAEVETLPRLQVVDGADSPIETGAVQGAKTEATDTIGPV